MSRPTVTTSSTHGEAVDQLVGGLGLAESLTVADDDRAADVRQPRGAGTPASSRATPGLESVEVDDDLAAVLLGEHGGLALEEADELGVRDAVGADPDVREGVTRDDSFDDPADERLGAVLHRRLEQGQRLGEGGRDTALLERGGERSHDVELGQLGHDPGRQLLLDSCLHLRVTREGPDDGDVGVGVGDRRPRPEGGRGHRHEHAAEHDHDRREDREPSPSWRDRVGGRIGGGRGRRPRGRDRDGVAAGAHAFRVLARVRAGLTRVV